MFTFVTFLWEWYRWPGFLISRSLTTTSGFSGFSSCNPKLPWDLPFKSLLFTSCFFHFVAPTSGILKSSEMTTSPLELVVISFPLRSWEMARGSLCVRELGPSLKWMGVDRWQIATRCQSLEWNCGWMVILLVFASLDTRWIMIIGPYCIWYENDRYNITMLCICLASTCTSNCTILKGNLRSSTNQHQFAATLRGSRYGAPFNLGV